MIAEQIRHHFWLPSWGCPVPCQNVLTLLLCAGLLFANAGCQPVGDTARIAVFGTVKSESGDPIDGTISFLPEAGTHGPAATASLIDGAFAFDTTNGPVAGNYRVLIVKQVADQKFKGASIPEKGARPPAAAAGDDCSATDEEWSFAAEVSLDNVEFEFQVLDSAADVASG
jgi:hypothetical protein